MNLWTRAAADHFNFHKDETMSSPAIMHPVINLNGTGREALAGQRIDIVEALNKVKEMMGRASPHGRDYIGQDRRYERDREIHWQRLAEINGLITTLEIEARQIMEYD